MYYLCYTKSYFSAYQQNSVQQGTDGFRLQGVFELDEDTEDIVCRWKQGKKEIYANDVAYEKPTDHIGKYAAVMIAPDDLELLNGGSELRRKWVDSVLGQVDRQYLEALMLYQRVLQQRNAWLKQEAQKPTNDFTAIEFYDKQLVQAGTYIYQQREQFLERFLPLLEKYYHELSQGKELIRAVYHSHLQKMPMAELLKKSMPNDMHMQRTLKGVHKDDWEFAIDGLAVKQFASQGQKKSFLFALKLAQYSYLEEEQGGKPILLLDDIFEKLDNNRIKALLHIIKDFGQVFLTDTDRDRVHEALGEGKEVGFIEL